MGKSFPVLGFQSVKMNMQLKGMSETRDIFCNDSDSSSKATGIEKIHDCEEVDKNSTLQHHLKSKSCIISDDVQEESWDLHRNICSTDDVDDGIGNSASSSVSQDQPFDFEIFKGSDFPQDDTDATISVSSDNTLESDTVESHKLHGKLKYERLKDESPMKERTQLFNESNLPQYASVMPQARLTDDVSVDVGFSNRFSKVLENISLPLLYIPTTKQLVKSTDCGSGSKESGEPSSVKNCEPQIIVHRDPDSPNVEISDRSTSNGLDLSANKLLHHSPLPKAHSTQEFHSISLLTTDSDRLTLHSVDSCPGFQTSYEPGLQNNLFADNSSLSSVSTGTDFSVSAVSVGDDFGPEMCRIDLTDESLFMEVNLDSRNSYDAGYKSASLDSGYGDKKPPDFSSAKKKSLSSLKSLFTKRAKEESPPGWKLFGRVPPKPASSRSPMDISLEYQSKHVKPEKPAFPPSGKKPGSEVMSTTALILENRPQNLPSKCPEEAEKHRQQYEEMVEAAKKKEMKDLKIKKKQLQQQRKQEDQMMAAVRLWNSEILPNWESVRNTKKVRELWWSGLPSNVRGKVWQLAIGNDLNITHALYNICHERAEERIKFVQEEGSSSGASDYVADSEEIPNKESSVKVIKLDVSRTFPQLCIFQKGGPFYDLLHSLLGAYACYRPDVGYVQGMSFIAAILLLNMDVADAFVCFTNLLNRPCQLAFFRMDENIMTAYYKTFEEFFKENLPKLYAHFISLNVTPNLYLMEWVFLIYSKSLPLDVACRVWDIFFRDGEEFLFRTAIAILKIYEAVLLKMDFIHVAQFLTKLPEDISGDQLFRELDSIRMNIDKRSFQTVHAFFKDLQTSGAS